MKPQEKSQENTPTQPAPIVPPEKKARKRKGPGALVLEAQARIREARPTQRCVDEIASMSEWSLEQVVSAVAIRRGELAVKKEQAK